MGCRFESCWDRHYAGEISSLTFRHTAAGPVTPDEREQLAAAVKAEGCSGGEFELDEDDRQFEVDDALCSDGKKYDLKFDMQMRLKRMNLD